MPDTAEPPVYSVECFHARASRERVLALWDRFWSKAAPGKRDLAEKFDWFYAGNPAGDPYVCELTGSGQPAGMSVECPRQFMLDGMPATGGLLMDFVVDPAHRSFYPAKHLQRTQHALALEHSEFLYGIPNQRARTFLQRAKLGMLEIQRPHLTTILRTTSYLRRILPGWVARPAGVLLDGLIQVRDGLLRLALPSVRAEWLQDFDERFDDLWQRTQREANCIGVRDRQFLSWRFRNQPGRKNLILAITRPGQRDSLLAYFVLETDGEVLAIRDTLASGSRAERSSSLFCLRRIALQMGARTITCHIACSAKNQMLLRVAGFRRRGYTLLFFKGRAGLSASGAARLDFWHMTEADEDI